MLSSINYQEFPFTNIELSFYYWTSGLAALLLMFSLCLFGGVSWFLLGQS